MKNNNVHIVGEEQKIASIRLAGIVASLKAMTEEGLIAVLNVIASELAERKVKSLKKENKDGNDKG